MKKTILKRILMTVLCLGLVSTTFIVAQEDVTSDLLSVSLNGSSETVTLQDLKTVQMDLSFVLIDQEELRVTLPSQLQVVSDLAGVLSADSLSGTYSLEGNVLTLKGDPGAYTLSLQTEYVKDDATELIVSGSKKSFNFNLVMEAPQAITPFILHPEETDIIQSIEFLDGDGNPVDINNPLKDGDSVQILFTWALDKSLDIKAGDTYEFNLPKAFPIYERLDEDLSGFGRFEVEVNGHVKMTFNAMAEPGNSDNVHGVLEVHTSLNTEHIDGPSDQEIHFPIGGGIDVPISVVPAKGNDIQKDGKVAPYNGKTTSWDIVINTHKKTIKNAVISDTLPTAPNKNELKLDPLSFEVILLVVNVDGSVSESTKAVDPSEYDLQFVGDNQFTLKFLHDINSAYRIRYEAEIVNAETTQGVLEFTNSASITGDDGYSFPASDTISTQYGKHLEKPDGVVIQKPTPGNPSAHGIEWTVKYNYNEKHVPEALAYIEDTVQEGYQHKLGSIKIYEVAIDANGGVTRTRQLDISEYDYSNTLIGDEHTLRIAFKNDIEKAYDIVYETYPIDGSIIDENTSIKNVVINGEGDNDEGHGKIDQNVVDKKLVHSDVDAKFAEWSIMINADNYVMENLVITDSFDRPEITYELGTLVLKKVGGAEYVKGEDYDAEVLNGVLTVTFKVTISSAIEMSYSTMFALEDANDVPISAYKNTVNVDWDDSNGSHHKTEDSDTLKLPGIIQKNGKKVGSYNPATKEITWTVYVNYNADSTSLPINSTITDTLSSIHESVIEESVIVFPYTVDSNGEIVGHPETPLVKDDIYSLSITPANVTEGNETPATILITTLKELPRSRGHIALQFKTSLNGETISASYKNTAIFNDTLHDYPLEATVSVKEGGNIIAKKGVQNGEDIDWTININFSRSTIENVLITDTPSTNQRLYNDSVVLYGTTLQTNGTSLIDENVVLEKGVDYTIEFFDDHTSGQESFVIKFIGKLAIINEGYILKYQSRADVAKDETVSNKVTLSGENTQIVEGDDGEDILVHHSGGSGSGTGNRGKILVTKTDGSGTPLKGAEFELYTRDGKTLWRGPALSNEKGEIDFGGITEGQYILRETKSPDGYIIDPQFATGYLVSVTNEHEVEMRNITPVDVTNAPQEVILSKYATAHGESKKPVANAQYQLVAVAQDGTETLGAIYTTDANGQIKVSPISNGKYYFIERAVPENSGLILNTEKIEFTIDIKNDGSDVSLALETENYWGSASIHKVDEALQPLEGVIFSLLKDGTVYRDNLETDASGMVWVYDLEPGTYHFVETSSVEGHIINTLRPEFTIAASAMGPVAIHEIKEFTNYLGSFSMTKVDAIGNPLSGVHFMLIHPDGLETELVSDAKGMVGLDKLKVGTYTLRETKAREGFLINTEALSFEIKPEASGPVNVLELKDYVNYQAQVVLRKVDDLSNALSGAEFTLIDAENRTQTVSSGADGIVRFDKLASGTYFLQETKAPNGYNLDSKIHKIVIPEKYEGALIHDIGDVVNTPIVPEVPEVPSEPGLPNTGVTSSLNPGWFMMALGFVLIQIKAMKKKRRLMR